MPALVLPNLDRRDRRPEWMDQPGLDPRLHQAALAGLRRVNRLSATPRVLWDAIRPFATRSARPLRILDIACGGGDVSLELWKRASREGVTLEVSGCDLSETAIDHARRYVERLKAPPQFFSCDVLQDSLYGEYDVVYSTLFLHHLERPAALRLMQRMATAARSLVMIDDLDRSRLGYMLAYFGTRLLSRSPIVHADGPASVEAAFTADEALELAHEAGWSGAQVSHHWPQRFLLQWERP